MITQPNKGLNLRAMLILLLLATLPATAQVCPNLAGKYTNKTVLTITGTFRGETQTQNYTNREEIAITQTNRCQFKYRPTDPASGKELEYTGSVNGKFITVTGKAFLPKTMIVHENKASATGTIVNGSLTLRGTGVVKGSLYGEDIELRTTFKSVISGPIFSKPTGTNSQTIVAQPGEAQSFCAPTIVGLRPLFFQWYKDGKIMAHATNKCLNLPSVTSADSGAYRLIASNILGTNKVADVTLGVCTYILGMTNADFGLEGGTNLVTVNVSNVLSFSNQCSWGISSDFTNFSWLHFTATNAGSFAYTVDPNTNEFPRQAVIVIGDQFHTITQVGTHMAPTEVTAKTFRFVMTNINDEVVTNDQGKVLITTSGADNRFRLFTESTNERFATAESGFYTYFTNAPDEGTLLFSDGVKQTTNELMFTNYASGYYVSTTESNSSSGLFSIRPSGPDIDNDFLPDLAVQSTNGQLVAWAMNGTNFLRSFWLPTPEKGWNVFGMSDFDQDGSPDLALQNQSSGQISLWLMNHAAFKTRVDINTNTNPKLRAFSVTDFNSDNHPDIIFQRNDGKIIIWLMNGTNVTFVATNLPTVLVTNGWQSVGTGDVDKDGFQDIVLKHNSGLLGALRFFGRAYVNFTYLRKQGPASSTGWTVRGVSDFNLDGNTEIYWQNDSLRKSMLWLFNGTNFLRSVPARNPAAGWHIVAPK